MPSLRWTTPLLLLLVPLVASQGVPSELVADTAAGTLTVRVAPSDDPLSAYVLVTYQDELAGDVIGRVVPVEVSPEGGVELTIEQLRPGVNVSVHLVERDVLDGLVEDAAALTNGSLVQDLPLLDGLDLGRQLTSALPLTLHAYRYAPYPAYPDGKGVNHPRVLMTPAGLLGVAYVASEFDGSGAEPVLHLSTDLGHRFGPVLPLAPGTDTGTSQGSNRGAFASQVATDGAFLFVTGHDDADRNLRDLTRTRVDPLTQAVTTATIVPPADVRPRNYSPAILPDGTALVVSHGGPRVTRFPADGSLPATVGLETDPGVTQWSDEVWVHAGPAGQVAVAWIVHSAAGPIQRFVRSHDGGLSWSAPANITGLPQGTWGPRIASGAIDDLGDLHLAVVVPQERVLNNTLRYVHAPRLGAPRVHELPWDAEPIQYVPEHGVAVAAAGGRAWILAEVVAPSDIVYQAGPAGAYKSRTFAWERLPLLGVGKPHEFTVQQAEFRFEGGAALMPDGRLVVVGSSGSGYAVVPTFDPFPEPACASKDPFYGTPTMTQGPGTTPQTCGDRFSLQSIAGAVQVRGVPVEGATTAEGDDGLIPAADAVPPEAVQVGVAAAAVAAVLGLASLEGVRYGLGLAAASLFSRVQGKQVLQHAIRGGIHDHIVANPGIRFTQIRKDLGLSHGATAYHLRVLERNGLVRHRVHWTTRLYDPVAGATTTAAATAATAGAPARDVILDFLRRNPGAGPSEVARHLGLSRQLAHYHLRRLAAAGRIGLGRGGVDGSGPGPNT